MINPAVITLSQKTIGGIHACIEDNIGESIHFHYGKFRIDLTINELLNITDVFLEVTRELIGDIFNEIMDYDPIFLNYISSHLSDLYKITDDEIELKNIICIGKVSKNQTGPTFLNKSFRFLALNGDTAFYFKIERDKPAFMTDYDRLCSVDSFVKQNKDIGNIVLLNDTNIILDGQHRAASLLFNFGNSKIKVKRFLFKEYKLNYRVRGALYYKLKSIKLRIFYICKRVLKK